MRLVNITMLPIEHKISGTTFEVNPFWLRDHCRCESCYNKETKQRKYNLLDIPSNIKSIESKYSSDDLKYEVEWSDGHTSVYDIDVLYAGQMETIMRNASQSHRSTYWNRATIILNQANLRTTLPELVRSMHGVHEVMENLIRYGIAFVNGVPANTEMTEMTVRRLFPPMHTFFGTMYTFSDSPDHADTAYTKDYLGLHTDNTYFSDAAGLQVLHCIRHVNGLGGDNFFADGFYAANELKRRNPRAFEILTRVAVPAEYIEEGQHHKHSAPIIRVDPLTGKLLQIRLNVYDRAMLNSIPQTEMNDFYESFRTFLEILQAPENEFRLKLNPGTVVFFDNWRVCHGRYAYTGQRTMTGCYVQRTDFLSKARVLRIID